MEFVEFVVEVEDEDIVAAAVLEVVAMIGLCERTAMEDAADENEEVVEW